MQRHELTEYIKQHLKSGEKKEQIVQTLESAGWKSKDIETAFTNVNVEAQINSAQRSGKKLVKIAIVVPIALLIIVGIVGYALYNYNRRENTEVSNGNTSVVNNTSTGINLDLIRNINLEIPSKYEIAFLDKLLECSPTKISFSHPLTGAVYEKRVVGIFDGLCVYTEQLPYNGLIECNYSEEERTEVVNMYKAINETGTYNVNTRVVLNPGETETESTYTVDGVELVNPLQTAIDDGTCVITGYDNLNQ